MTIKVRLNAIDKNNSAIRRMSLLASDQALPGTLHSLLTRNLGFPRVRHDEGGRLEGQGENMVIIRMAPGGGGDVRAEWMFVEWTMAGKNENRLPRILVATGSFSMKTQGRSRVTIQAVAIGEIARARADQGRVDQITYKGGAKVGGTGENVYRTEDLGERRMFALCSGFNGDGRGNCSVHFGVLPQNGAI